MDLNRKKKHEKRMREINAKYHKSHKDNNIPTDFPNKYTFYPTSQSILLSELPKVNGLVKIKMNNPHSRIVESSKYENPVDKDDVVYFYVVPIGGRGDNKYWIDLPNSNDIIVISKDLNDVKPKYVLSLWQKVGQRAIFKSFINQWMNSYGYWGGNSIKEIIKHKEYGYWLIGMSPGADGPDSWESIWIGFLGNNMNYNIAHTAEFKGTEEEFINSSDASINHEPFRSAMYRLKYNLEEDKMKLYITRESKIVAYYHDTKKKVLEQDWKVIWSQNLDLNDLVKKYINDVPR